MTDHSTPLSRAIGKVLEGFSAGVFVRSTDHDSEPGWAVKMLPYMQALSKLANSLDAPVAPATEQNAAPQVLPEGIRGDTESNVAPAVAAPEAGKEPSEATILPAPAKRSESEVSDMLRLAVRQNSHDMLMTGDEIRRCEAALLALRRIEHPAVTPQEWRELGRAEGRSEYVQCEQTARDSEQLPVEMAGEDAAGTYVAGWNACIHDAFRLPCYMALRSASDDYRNGWNACREQVKLYLKRSRIQSDEAGKR